MTPPGRRRPLLPFPGAGLPRRGRRARVPARLPGLAMIAPPASYLVDLPSDAPGLKAARMGEPPFEAAIAASDAGPDTSSDETFNAWQQAIAPLCYATWNETAQEHARV